MTQEKIFSVKKYTDLQNICLMIKAFKKTQLQNPEKHKNTGKKRHECQKPGRLASQEITMPHAGMKNLRKKRHAEKITLTEPIGRTDPEKMPVIMWFFRPAKPFIIQL